MSCFNKFLLEEFVNLVQLTYYDIKQAFGDFNCVVIVIVFFGGFFVLT